jgi:hypothetical protein
MGDIGISEFLAGLLAASVITVVGTSWLERLRWQREDKLRFNQQKLQTYARFLGLVDLERQTQKARDHKEHAELVRNFTQAQAELMVLASQPVRDTASALFNAILSEPKEGESPYTLFANEREKFLEAVRKELGIPVPPQDRSQGSASL